ncbi:hypothetical protein ES705_01666 [subsurface metagenome]|nr:hypothetical protein [Clostridia bacterium]
MPDISELSEKHFSRYGEFLVSFELSKYGWNIYNPVYDEYIDFIIHKFICKDCGKLWNQTPALVCKNCGKDFSKSLKKDIIAKKICRDCGHEMIGNKILCSNCKSRELLNKPTCDDCDGEIEMIKYTCECGSSNYETKFRTIQVKSSRIEIDKKTGKNKNTYAVDMKPRDLIKGKHYFIWCLIDTKDMPHFLVMSVKDFEETMGNSLKGISFFKDQDRQHFSASNFGKWGKFLDKFEKLD